METCQILENFSSSNQIHSYIFYIVFIKLLKEEVTCIAFKADSPIPNDGPTPKYKFRN